MDKKPNLFQVLVETVGLPAVISTIVGVPAMITLLVTIWSSLSQNQRIVVTVSVAVIVFAVVYAFYGQTRKVLYVIPKILLQMHMRRAELASQLRVATLTAEDYAEFMSLVNIDATQVRTSLLGVKDLDSLVGHIPDLIKLAETQTDSAKKEAETPLRVYEYMYDKIGLKKAVEGDKIHQNLSQQLNKLNPLVPSVDIRTAIITYNNVSRAGCSFLPLFQSIGDQMIQLLPLKYKIDRTRKVEQFNDQMMILLARVRETIDKYYKGK